MAFKLFTLPFLSPLVRAAAMASWACTRCTFINTTPSHTAAACAMCLSPAAAATPASSFRQWSCKACTFANPFGTRACEVCGTRATTSFDELALDEDDLSDPAIGSVFRPLQRCSTARPNPDVASFIDIDDDEETAAATKEAGSTFPSMQRCSSKSGLTDNVVSSHTENMPRKEKMPLTILGSAFPPMQRCSNKRGPTNDLANFCKEKMPKEELPSAVAGNVEPTSKRDTLKILSYNVWFREDLEVHKRMKALGDLIQAHTPDIICFQEVTPNIYEIFQKSNWWKAYTCSLSHDMASERPYFCMQMSKVPVKAFDCKPFSNSMMGRELSLAEVDAGMGRMLVVATSHLESPCPAPPRWDQMYSKERVAQAKESIGILGRSPNVIFCGDMNWDDKLDGAFPLPDGWVDAWSELRPREDGWTYDTKANQMLSGNRKLQKRLDRFLCNLRDFKVDSIQMIGIEAIPELFYTKEKKVKNEYKKIVLPVLPSDHFGLLLTIFS